MKIRELFLKPVDRPIDGVIKADDARNLQTELEEYVVTRDVARGLGIFTDRYLTELTANGVWISGFFGSGKSHLLKILSLILDGQPLANGRHPADIVLPKLDDEIVKANLRKAAAIPSRSILFNIDQKFDGIGGDHSAPILEVFVKVLNELQGYYGQQGYIARFEHDLAVRGDLGPFQATYLRVNGAPWEKDREAIATARKAAFARAYAEHFGVAEAEAASLMRQVREDYRVSIESFAQMVKEYLAHQPPGFRLNFFVDEVGQFIGQNSKFMLNLQTVAVAARSAAGANHPRPRRRPPRHGRLPLLCRRLHDGPLFPRPARPHPRRCRRYRGRLRPHHRREKGIECTHSGARFSLSARSGGRGPG